MTYRSRAVVFIIFCRQTGDRVNSHRGLRLDELSFNELSFHHNIFNFDSSNRLLLHFWKENKNLSEVGTKIFTEINLPKTKAVLRKEWKAETLTCFFANRAQKNLINKIYIKNSSKSVQQSKYGYVSKVCWAEIHQSLLRYFSFIKCQSKGLVVNLILPLLSAYLFAEHLFLFCVSVPVCITLIVLLLQYYDMHILERQIQWLKLSTFKYNTVMIRLKWARIPVTQILNVFWILVYSLAIRYLSHRNSYHYGYAMGFKG